MSAMGQVDVTAADAAGQGKIPAVNQQAAVSVQTTGMINTALQHMGLGADPWKAVKVGGAPDAAANCARCPHAQADGHSCQDAALVFIQQRVENLGMRTKCARWRVDDKQRSWR